MLDAILFDLDGTLLNTLDDLRNAANHAIVPFGYKEVSKDEVKRNIGNGILMLIKRCINFEEEHLDEIFKSFKNYYYNNCNVYTKPYDGINDILLYAYNNKIKLGVVTNKAINPANELVSSHFPGAFDIVVGDLMDVGLERKPSCDMVNYALSKLGIDSKNNVLYIGDSDVDVKTALNSDVRGAFVTYGYRDKSELEKITDNCFSDTKTLLQYIKELNDNLH